MSVAVDVIDESQVKTPLHGAAKVSLLRTQRSSMILSWRSIKYRYACNVNEDANGVTRVCVTEVFKILMADDLRW